MKVVAVIPCLNEEREIADVVSETKEYVAEVVVSDDGSVDKTESKAESRGAHVYGGWWPVPIGMGANTRYGICMANLHHYPDVIVTLDGDGQHIAGYIPSLVEPIESGKADIAIAVRGYDTPMPVYRKFGNWMILKACNIFAKQKFTDATCCLRAFNSNALEIVRDCQEPRYGFSTELLIKARARGLRIAEVSVACKYHRFRHHNSKMPPLRQGIGLLFATLKWRLKVDLPLVGKSYLYRAFRQLITPFRGRGLSDNWLVGGIYKWLVRRIMPNIEREVVVNNSRMIVGSGRRDSGGISESLLYGMEYEPETTRMFNTLLKPSMNAVDVGANIGYYTLLASTLVGNSGKVWAFEPESHNYGDLCRNIALNGYGNIVQRQSAVSDCGGIGKLHVARYESGVHSLVICRDKGGTIQEVEMVTLDAALMHRNGQVDLIKSDTEGNEVAVINGAKGILKCNPQLILIVEWWPQSKEDLWGKLNECFSYIYLVSEWERKTHRITDVAEAQHYVDKHGFGVNLLCSNAVVRGLN